MKKGQSTVSNLSSLDRQLKQIQKESKQISKTIIIIIIILQPKE